MAATPVSPSDPDAPRPLPRRGPPRPGGARAIARPRLQPLDTAWAVGLAALALAHLAVLGDLGEGRRLCALCAAAAVAALYGLGWRARDRAAGVTAALLAATSGPFLHAMAYAGQSGPLTLLLTGALLAFVWGSSLIALALCALAALVRPDAGLLGLLLLGLALVQGRRRAAYGAAVFGVPLLAVWSGRIALGHRPPPLPVLHPNGDALAWLLSPASLLLLGLLLPLAGELSEPMRRARWLPVLLWAGLAALAASLLRVTTPWGMTLPLMPPLFALAGGGLSRLLPTLAGEFPGPAPRYVLATLAVLGLVGLHARLERPYTGVPTSPSTSTAPGPASPAPAARSAPPARSKS